MRPLVLIVPLLMSASAMAAPAAVLKSSGPYVFHKVGCVDENLDESFNECGCEVKVEYQQIEGNEAINKLLAPDADMTSYCNTLLVASLKESQADAKWEPAKAEDFKKGIFQFSSKQEATFMSPQWLNVVSYDYVYSGGAHGNTGIASTLYDIKTANKIDFISLLNLQQVALVNKDIHQQLTARKEEMFPHVLEKSPEFITPDGKCVSCEYVLRNDGLHAVFHAYAVGPGSSGLIEVKLPTTFLNQPIITMAKGS